MGQVEQNEQQQINSQVLFLNNPLRSYQESPPSWLSNSVQQPLTNYPAPRVIALVLSIMVSSALDAFWTLLHLNRGLHEANPLMAQTLVYGPTFFIALKMTLTGAGALILALHQRSYLARQGLRAMALVYALLLGYHLVLFWLAP